MLHVKKAHSCRDWHIYQLSNGIHYPQYSAGVYVSKQPVWWSDLQCFVYTPVSYTYVIKEQLVNRGSRRKIVYSSNLKNRGEGDCEEEEEEEEKEEEEEGAGLEVTYDFVST